jgi:hydroxymethylpyrimidine pyrophosphatase-like HAD family hydrolase
MQPGPRYTERSRRPVRAIYFDVDNTLVGNESPSLPSNRFLAAARRLDGRPLLGIASARPLPKVAHILQAIGADAISVLSNGALLYDSAPVAEWPLAAATTGRLAEALRHHRLDYWISEGGVDYFWHNDHYEQRLDQWRDQPRQPVEYTPGRPAVVVAHGVPADRLGQISALAEASGDPDITTLIGHEAGSRFDVLILDRRANKPAALNEALARQGLTMADVAFVGDGHNDVELIRAAGTGIALANAVPEAQAAAAYVAPAQDHDGAAIALEHLLG